MDLGNFEFGKPKVNAAGFRCCGKPIGCSVRDEGCAYLNHPWKRTVLLTQTADQLVFARVRDRLTQEAPHVQPGSISYLALAWQFMIDEWVEMRG